MYTRGVYRIYWYLIPYENRSGKNPSPQSNTSTYTQENLSGILSLIYLLYLLDLFEELIRNWKMDS